jgi:hypothetical protein
MVFSPLPMRRPAAPTLRSVRDSSHTWKLTLHKQDGTKLVRFASTKKHALTVGQTIHNGKERPTKMFHIEKVK